MLDDRERIEAARRIAAVRRWSRNGDTLALCDLLEKACSTVSAGNVSAGNASAGNVSAGNVTLAELAKVTPCLACEKRRKGNATRQARHKANKAGKAATKPASKAKAA